MTKQRGYINIDVTGMILVVFFLGAVFFGILGVVVGVFLPDSWAWVKALLHGWTAP